MSGLFIRLYLDEDVDVLVAEMVRAHGFDALTTREAGRAGAEGRGCFLPRGVGKGGAEGG